MLCIPRFVRKRRRILSDVLDHANRNKSLERNFTYIVLGRTGTTGKSCLTESLKNNGHTAVEISPLVNPFIDYEVLADCNFMIEYGDTVAVFLGKPVNRD